MSDFFKEHYSTVKLSSCESVHDVLSKRISELSEERYAVSLRIAELLCPFKVGDKIIDLSGVKAVVTRISNKYGSKTAYQMFIRKIKAGGEPFKNECEGWRDGWSLDK